MVGSLAWLAPEIVMGTDKYSKASDVYSLGLILYELATGKVPYRDLPNKPTKPNSDEIKNWIVGGERLWKYLPRDCPIELSQLICECCAEEPIDRPSANIVAERLQQMYSMTQQSFTQTLIVEQDFKERKNYAMQTPSTSTVSGYLPPENNIIKKLSKVESHYQKVQGLLSPGESLICMVIPPDQSPFLLLTCMSSSGIQQEHLYRLHLENFLLCEMIPIKNLPDLQTYETIIQTFSLSHFDTLHEEIQKQVSKPFPNDSISNGCIDWAIWVAQIKKLCI